MAFGEFLFGSPEKTEQYTNYNPQQLQAFMQILQQALGGLQNPSKGFEPIANEATRKFNTEYLPGLAERFGALPGEGGAMSQGFRSELANAGANFHSQLAGQQAQFGQQNQSQLMQLLGMGLTPTHETNIRQAQPGLFHYGAQGLGTGAGLAGAGAIGGSSAFGNLINKLFGVTANTATTQPKV
jgi:hypothetical protein